MDEKAMAIKRDIYRRNFERFQANLKRFDDFLHLYKTALYERLVVQYNLRPFEFYKRFLESVCQFCDRSKESNFAERLKTLFIADRKCWPNEDLLSLKALLDEVSKFIEQRGLRNEEKFVEFLMASIK